MTKEEFDLIETEVIPIGKPVPSIESNSGMKKEENLGQRIDSNNFTNDDFRSFNSIRSLIEKL